jgi:hypothetical protein
VMDEPQIGPGTSSGASPTSPPMRGAVVHNPEDPRSRGVGLLSHHLIYQPVEGLNTVLRLAGSEELDAVDIPGNQVSHRPFTFVLMFDPHRPIFTRGQDGNGGGPEWRPSRQLITYAPRALRWSVLLVLWHRSRPA